MIVIQGGNEIRTKAILQDSFVTALSLRGCVGARRQRTACAQTPVTTFLYPGPKPCHYYCSAPRQE